MNINEVSKGLGISDKTLRNWEKNFKIKVKRGERNYRRYDKKTIQIFKTIKDLKNEKRSNDTIIKKIKPTLEQYEINLEDNTEINRNQLGANIKMIMEMENKIVATIENKTELSEKYAKATYQIGKLEEKVETQNKQIKNLEEEIKLLPAPVEHNEIKKELELIKKENEYLKLPWYKKIFK